MFVKADIFDHPVSFAIDEVTSVDTPMEALSASFNKFGAVNLDYMTGLVDMSEENLIQSLEGHIYYNPLVENYEIKDRFIARNVVQKAEDVKAWIDREEERIKGFPGYDGIEPYIAMAQDSLKALEEATPRKITFDELDFNFGERWIPTGIHSAYMSNLYGADMQIAYSSSMDEYSCEAQRKNMKIWEAFCVRGYYRTYDGISLLKHALHNTVPDIKKSAGKDENGHDIKVPDSEAIQLANTKIDEIRNGFADWLEAQSPEFKEKLSDLYNRKFNCFVRPVAKPYKPTPFAEEPTFENIEKSRLESPVLLRYLADRGIPTEIAQQYCVQVDYELHGKRYYAIGFPDNTNGLELRNPFFKGSYPPKHITIIADCNARRNVFEGFIDFLSAERLGLNDGFDSVGLNSVANVGKALTILPDYSVIACYLNNDETGSWATR